MIEQFLNRIMGSLKDNESSDRRFRNEAAKNDKTLFSSIKDLSKRFSISEQNIDSINDSIESTNAEVQRSNQKIDSMQGLIRESISMQAQMLTELGAIKSDFKDLKESIEKKSSDGGIVGNFLNSLKQGAKSLGLGAAGLAGLGSIDALVDMFKENIGGFDTTGELTGGSPGASDSSQGAGAQISKGASTAVNKDIPTEARAFLDSLTAPGYEGTQNFPGGGYNTIVGGKQFRGYEDHPRKVGVVTAQGPSTAAGRYQITKTTWDELRKRYPELTDFSPKNQDLAAWLLAQERYSANTRGNLLDALKSGDPKILAGVERALAGTWSSLRGGVHQGSSAGSFSNFYSKNLENLQKQTPVEQENKAPESGQNTPEAGGDPKAIPIKKEQISTTGNIDLQSFSLKPPSHVQGFDKDFSKRLGQFLSDAQKQGYNIKIYSGYRSPEHQKRLWENALKKYGSPEAARKWVAPPGRSRHNQGIAADLRYLSPGSENWAHKNASKYGLHFRMGHEPWHIEPINTQGVSRRENVSDNTNVDGYDQQNFASTAAGATGGSLDFSGFSALESGLAGLGISLPTGGLLSAVSKIFGVDFGGLFGNLASAFGLTGGNDSQYQQTSSQNTPQQTPQSEQRTNVEASGDSDGTRREADNFPGNFIENIQRNFSLVMDTMSKEKTITQENQPASPQDYTTMAMSAPNVDYNGGNRWNINPEKTAFANWARGDNWVIEPISGIKKNQPEWYNRLA